MNEKKSKRSPWAGVFGSILIAGLLTIPPVLGFREWSRYSNGQTWPEISCTMHEMLQKRGRRTNYVYTLQYNYRVDGKFYESGNYGLMASPNDEVMDFGNAHPNGSIVPCFVNPADPRDVVLRRDAAHIPALYWIFPAIFGLLWLGAAAYAILWLMNRFRTKPKLVG